MQSVGNNQVKTLAIGGSLHTGYRLIGAIDGTGSRAVSLTYRIDNQPAESPIPVSNDGLFNQVLSANRLAPGKYRLTLTATDEAGNQRKSGTYQLVVSKGDRLKPPQNRLLVRLLHDTGRDPNDGWTQKPDIVGYVLVPQKITRLEARLLAQPLNAIPRKNQRTPSLEQPHIPFQDITSVVQPNGTFLINTSLLKRLDYAGLDDGAYTLELKAQFEGNTQSFQHLGFIHDGTAPSINLANFDGIAWTWEERLRGSVQENLSDVEISYQLIEKKNRRFTSKGSFKVQNRRIDILLPEFVKNQRLLEEEKSYTLVLQGSDRAGNQSYPLTYDFFIPGDRRVVDDDVWIPDLKR
jgi:hypothetical protein